jgi:hypothetical protein
MEARSAGDMGLGMGLLGGDCFGARIGGGQVRGDRQEGADAGASRGTSSAEAGQRERQRGRGRGRHWTLGPNGGLSRMGRDMRWARGCGGCVRKQHVSLGVQAWAVQACRQCGVGGGTLVGR